MKRTILTLIALLSLAHQAISQFNSNWQFIGPYSENPVAPINPNKFQCGQVNHIAIDPTNSNHIFTGGRYAGLWESHDGGDSWSNIETSPYIGCNGVSTFTFRNGDELYVSNSFSDFHQTSTSVYRYNFITHAWTQLGNIPNPSNHKFRITRIVFYPSNLNLVFLCTTNGLFKSTDAGTTWIRTDVGNICNILFLKRPTLPIFDCIISGTSPSPSATEADRLSNKGGPLLKKSTNIGTTFVNLGNSTTSFATYLNSNFPRTRMNLNICLGNVSNPANREVYVHCITGSDIILFKLRLNTSLVIYTTPNSLLTYGQSSYDAQRNPIQFDPINNCLWHGAVQLRDFHLPSLSSLSHDHYNASVLANDGGVHHDIWDIVVSGNKIYVACDGGFYKGDLNMYSTIASHNIFVHKSNGLNVSAINGFSQASNSPHYYLLGYQDIVSTDFYDAKKKRLTFTYHTWENDGGIIDKFNNGIAIADQSSYCGGYNVYSGGGQNLISQVGPDQYNGGIFGTNTYYQDPFRERLYTGTHGPAINRFSFSTNTFAKQSKFQSFTIPPVGPGMSSLWNSPFTGIAFSRQDPNSVHLTSTSNFYDTGGAIVVQYIGQNFESPCDADNTWTPCPDWINITPRWDNLSNFYSPATFSAIPLLSDRKKFDYSAIVKSTLDKNVVYITCRVSVAGFDPSLINPNQSRIVPGNPTVKVMKYDGIKWSNYSTGIPLDVNPSHIVLDIFSNDGIYLATDKGIYYRDNSMTQWLPFNLNLPKMLIKQLEINYVEKTITAATFGRGLWKSPLKCSTVPLVTEAGSYSSDKTVEAGKIESTASIPDNRYIIYRGTNSIELKPGFTSTSGSNFKEFIAFINPCAFFENTTGPGIGMAEDSSKTLEISWARNK